MSIWIVIALIILGFGLLIGLFEASGFLFCLPFLALEGIIYGLTKLPAWVLGWETTMVVKIAFMAMPYLIVAGALLVIIGACLDKGIVAIVGGLVVVMGIMAGITAAVFQWIPTTGWRIAVMTILPLLIAFICVCAGESSGSGGSDTTFYEKEQQPWIM